MLPLKRNLQIGAWTLDRELGSGGQGCVWKVRYAKERHSPPGALKLCTKSDAKSRARFQREITLLREQNDPGVIGVRDAGEHEGLPYYVMELASTSLSQVVVGDTAGTRLLRESGPLLLRLLRQACSALAGLHERNVLHRDVKPSNILLMLDPPEPMKAVLCDLGIAAIESDQGQLTATHEVVGTPVYRAPEAVLGRNTPASDVYAFGKTLEFVFAGGLPSHVGPGRCSRSALFSSELWDLLDAILHRACAFNPGERFPNAREMLLALPETLVAPVGQASNFTTSRSDTTLSPSEITTLVAVIANCLTDNDWTNVGYLQSEVKLSAYRFSLALRRLVELELVESRETIDYDNDRRESLLRPSAGGVRWAQSHTSEVDAVLQESSTEYAPADPDDIPF